MRLVIAALMLSAVAVGSASAQTPQASCKMQATEKKLAGAALTSFTKKCETDAKAACEKTAADKKLAGAAKTSFVTKCQKDAIGM